MSITIETKQNQDGSFSPTTIENQYELKQLVICQHFIGTVN